MKAYEIRRILYGYSNDELCEIYDNLNQWKWDERLGVIPKDFYELPNHLKQIDGECKRRYIAPFMKEIHRIVSEYDLLKYHYLHNLGRTEEEFEGWWRNEGQRFNKVLHPTGRKDSVNDVSVSASVFSAIVVSVAMLFILLNLFQ